MKRILQDLKLLWISLKMQANHQLIINTLLEDNNHIGTLILGLDIKKIIEII